MPGIEAFTSANDITLQSRCRDQISFLTLEEKVSLLSGVSFTSTASVQRLNIPALKVVIFLPASGES
ncbi:glycosyl hydrolase [Penicillium verhagenii]|uniref:glycosyl hydrolase n=1 Tax=Penicillium verhagenii TaxID=1562060 RepID=UPI002545269A|nr:glycosyl hydrolase [Penicillium verhagenii]KAJ5929912.1 glycosyl hydrolase [Penicillium verhagenii]